LAAAAAGGPAGRPGPLAHRCCSKMEPPKTDDAIRFYTAALALRSKSPGAHLNLGNALADKGQLGEAVAAYRQAIRLKKDFAEAHCNMGVALAKQGQLEEAVAAYREAIRLKKDLHAAHYNLGNALGRSAGHGAPLAHRRAEPWLARSCAEQARLTCPGMLGTNPSARSVLPRLAVPPVASAVVPSLTPLTR
jgi:tetratricopeptide (TPR) repeat protein